MLKQQAKMKHRLRYRFMVIGLINASTSSNMRNDGHNLNHCSISNDVIRRGHSHNDYHQRDPLKSALVHGLRSIEVDVFPLGDELCVAHTRLELDEKKTINNLYVT